MWGGRDSSRIGANADRAARQGRNAVLALLFCDEVGVMQQTITRAYVRRVGSPVVDKEESNGGRADPGHDVTAAYPNSMRIPSKAGVTSFGNMLASAS